MPEEPITPSLATLSRSAVEAVGHRDFEEAMRFYTDDSVWDVSAMGLGIYRGAESIRRELEHWTGAYEQFAVEVEEVRDLGNGMVLSVTRQGGRPLGSSGHVQMRFAAVTEWRAGSILRVTAFLDVDEARAAAERLVKERGQAVSTESATPGLLERIRSHFEAANRGDLDAVLLSYAPGAVWDATPTLGSAFEGHAAIRDLWREWSDPYEAIRFQPKEIADLGGGIVFARIDTEARPVGVSACVQTRGALVYEWLEGMVARVTAYSEIDEARAAAERLAKERA